MRCEILGANATSRGSRNPESNRRRTRDDDARDSHTGRDRSSYRDERDGNIRDYGSSRNDDRREQYGAHTITSAKMIDTAVS